MGFWADNVDEDVAGIPDEDTVKLVDALASIVVVVPASGLFYIKNGHRSIIKCNHHQHTTLVDFLITAWSIVLSEMISLWSMLTHLPPHSSLCILSTRSAGDTASLEEVGHDFRGMCILYHASYAMYCFCWLGGLTWVVWAYIAAYGKHALIRIRDQPPLRPAE